MAKGSVLEKILDKKNKGIGLTILLISLLMIFSLILFPYIFNPIIIFEIVLMFITGFSGIIIIWLFIIGLSLKHYFNLKIEWLTKRRVPFLLVFIYCMFMLISITLNSNQIDYKLNEIHPYLDYMKITILEPLENINNTGFSQRIAIHDLLRFNGIILPNILWLIGGLWWNSIITLLMLVLLILYSLYVLITNEYSILLSNLAFWINDRKKISTNQKISGIDLNQNTEEFELNFDKTEESKEKIELIEKVRKNMNKKNYEDLSNKIADEKRKLLDLRERVLDRVKKNREEHLSKSNVSENQRQEIMASLGCTTYSSMKARIAKNEASAQSREPFRITKPENYIEEETIQENVDLINEGFKTTEEVIKIEESNLGDSFIEDMLDGFEPTQETPLLNDYLEIFEKEEKLIDQINKTLETIVQIEDDIQEKKDSNTEIVIEELDEEVTVEEYLSIPDVIAKSQELQINLNQSNAIMEQKSDHTNDNELTSIKEEATVEDALKLINEIKDELENEDIKVDEENQLNISEEEVKMDFVPFTIRTDETNEDEIDIDKTYDENEKKTEESSYLENETEENFVNYEPTIEEDEEEIEIDRTKRPSDWCKPYVLPSTSILTTTASSFDNSILVQEATKKASDLNTTFESFGVKAQVNSFEIGPTITTFKITLEPGIKTTKVTNLEDNIKLTLGAEYIRILAPIPGTSFIGIEIPNSNKKPVLFKTVYDETHSTQEGIIISIGQDVSGKSLSFDLTKAPHLLVAGSTGSGKSVAINTILASILLRYKPEDVQLVLVDPKMVEFAPFHGVPHLLAEVITDAQNANNALKAMVEEMENRYRQMASMGVKKLEELNSKLISQGEAKLPYIVIVIDELADLMMVAAKEVEDSIMRITQKARAAGIHMILATQRPSTEIITGTIKSNIPSRMAFTVASSIDSRTILGQVGAEKLIGMGDMLVSLYGQLPFRGQGAYISNEEVEDIASFTKSQCSAHYQIDVNSLIEMTTPLNGSLISINDPLYIAARDTVIHHQKATTSMLQRHLNIGYNKAANIIETLESEGVIGPARGSAPREVLK